MTEAKRKFLCIYHADCVDGFTAAWIVKNSFLSLYGAANLLFYAAKYDQPPPDVTDCDVVIVDFSYPLEVVAQMATKARSILILDHHKTAETELADLNYAGDSWIEFWRISVLEAKIRPVPNVYCVFDKSRSGAAITWDFLHNRARRPALINYVQDHDLWLFHMEHSRALRAFIRSQPRKFESWDELSRQCEDPFSREQMAYAGAAIMQADEAAILDVLKQGQRRMWIGGYSIPVCNTTRAMSSDAANLMAITAPFAATYFDSANAREFSLRSNRLSGVDVSVVAKLYGGGGHENAAGFAMPHGWEGENPDELAFLNEAQR